MKKTWTYFKAILFTSGAILPFYIGYDVLFSQPRHLQGIIIEKIFVPARGAVGGSPFWGAHRGNYVVTVQKQAQWIAVVKMNSGDTLSVHCVPSHYDIKAVGDTIHFKRYEGEHLHIQYFAHNEEED